MKPFTKEVYERCMDILKTHGLSRRRRGLGIFTISEEIQGAIALFHRDFPDGSVEIHTVPQVYWETVQRLYSAGRNLPFRAFEQPTRTRMWSFINFGEPKLIFEPNSLNRDNFTRLSAHVEWRVLGKVLEMAEPKNALQATLDELPSGGHRPKIFLSIKAWINRTLELDDEFNQAISLLDHDHFIQSLTRFYDQLKQSDVAHELIKTGRVSSKPRKVLT